MVSQLGMSTLAHTIIEPDEPGPGPTFAFVHGILGTGRNWRTMARRVVKARSRWRAVLVDLREHGKSLHRPPPHTLETAAQDLLALEDALGTRFDAVLGHSFGGKVVLEWSRHRAPSEIWVVDSQLNASDAADGDARASEVDSVLRSLRDLPPRFANPEQFVEAVVSAGQPKPIAQWLAMNLKRNEDGSRSFGPRLNVIDELLKSYTTTDSWPVLESAAPDTLIHIVVAGRSQVISQPARDRLAALSEAHDNIKMHLVADSGHWVHVEATDALSALINEGF